MQPEKSIGHILFYEYAGTTYEVYTLADGDVYRAPVGNIMYLEGPNKGRRVGRFEFPAHMQDVARQVFGS